MSSSSGFECLCHTRFDGGNFKEDRLIGANMEVVWTLEGPGMNLDLKRQLMATALSV